MVVRLIQGSRHGGDAAIMDAMFRGRAAVFSDRLRWDVVVRDGWEKDEYDDLDPLYLISVSEKGDVRGSLRLMPTTGPTLLTGTFAAAFDEPVDIRSANVWEGSRFCVHPDRHGVELTRTGLNLATCELFAAMCEVSLMAGLINIIGVYDPRLARIYRRIGWSPEPLGSSDAFEHGRIHVGLWDVSEAALTTMQQRSGFVGSVIEPGAPLARKVG